MRRSRFNLSPEQTHRERGFALLIVLWALVFITLVITQVTAAGREELRIAGNLMANAQARAAADGAIYDAIFHLCDPRPDRRWQSGQGEHKTSIGDASITLTIDDEAALINPNLASPALLVGLLRALGAEPAIAADLAAGIGEWVGSIQPAPAVSETAERYRAAGLDYMPPAAPFETLDELSRVRGMSAAVFLRMRSHLTLYGPADPNPASADPIVAAAINFAISGSLTGATATSPVTAPRTDQLTAHIRAVAFGANRAQVIRVAIIRVDGSNAQGYAPLSWRDGD